MHSRPYFILDYVVLSLALALALSSRAQAKALMALERVSEARTCYRKAKGRVIMSGSELRVSVEFRVSAAFRFRGRHTPSHS